MTKDRARRNYTPRPVRTFEDAGDLVEVLALDRNGNLTLVEFSGGRADWRAPHEAEAML